MLAAGASREEILADYLLLEDADVRARGETGPPVAWIRLPGVHPVSIGAEDHPEIILDPVAGAVNNSHHAAPLSGGVKAFSMSRLIFALAFWLSVAVGTWIVTTSPSSAAGPFETSGNVRWIIYASRQNVDEAIGLARRFGSEARRPSYRRRTAGMPSRLVR